MTRRTQFKGNSRSRRRERLKAKALANGVLAREEAISSEVLHRPTLSRAQIQAKGTHETPERIEDAKPIKFIAQDVIWQQKEYRRNLERAAIVYPVTPDGWISCSERMPEDTKMLLAFSQGEIVAAYWNWVVNPIDYKKYRAFTYLSGNILDDVTHWMPLPEPPL